MKKINWGTKIRIAASVYVIDILAFVGFSATQNINLVSKNYYPKEVKYQDQINKINNANNLTESVSIQQNDGKIHIQFPQNLQQGIEGNITFYRPADYKQDLQFKIALNEASVQILDSKNLQKGRYTVKIDWVQKNVPYYKEETIYLSK